MRFIVLTGTSGAGKTTALRYFDDLGYYAVDNLPPALLSAVAVACRDMGRERVIVVVDARCGDALANTQDAIYELAQSGCNPELLFLDADDEALVRRFKETRRPHPVFEKGDGSILDAIRTERSMLEELRGHADRIVDSSSLSTMELIHSLGEIAGNDQGRGLLITVESFGFKYGIPIDADLVFDVRFLVNPYYIASLRHLTGTSPEVAEYIHKHPLTEPFIEKMFDFISFSLPQYQREGKAYLTIAIGCTGGRHRSVTVAEDLSAYLLREGYRVAIQHRDRLRESQPGEQVI